MNVTKPVTGQERNCLASSLRSLKLTQARVSSRFDDMRKGHKADSVTELKEAVGRRLQIAREALGLRPIDIANATDVHRAKISQYEAGKYFPRQQWLLKLRKLYRIDANYLFFGELDGLPPGLREKVRKIEERRTE